MSARVRHPTLDIAQPVIIQPNGMPNLHLPTPVDSLEDSISLCIATTSLSNSIDIW